MYRSFIKIMAGFFILAVGVFGGVVLDRQVLLGYLPPRSTTANSGPDYQLISEAWNLIQQDYVDRSAVQKQQLTYGAVSGMVDALGDTGHSRFMSPQAKQDENTQTAGQFAGVGVEVDMVNGLVTIVSPIDGSPAQKAGLQPGEIILKVDGVDLSSLSLDQVAAKIRGPVGTKVTLTLQDPKTGNTQDVTLTRAVIKVQNVTWQQIPGTTIADVRIASFSQGVTADLDNALTQIKQQGMTGIILDLRYNPGGLLDEAVGVTSAFVKSGNVLLEKNAQGKTTPVPVKAKGLVTDLPVVALINQGTASAAEIVAGSLNDNQRATLVGETTFGTGTVLQQFDLSDGSAILLATEEWLTPAGNTIWHKGITPKDVVQLTANTSPLTPNALKQLTASQLQGSTDNQLLQALTIIESATVKSPTGP